MVPACNKGVSLHESAKGTSYFLNFCFLMFVAEHIEFDTRNIVQYPKVG